MPTTFVDGLSNLEVRTSTLAAGYFADQPDGIPPAGLYDRILHEIERPLIRLTLTATRGNQVRAAEILGINRGTLRRKLEDYGLVE